MDSASPTTGGSDLDSNESLFSSASSNYSLTTPSGVPSAQGLIQNMKSTLEALDVRRRLTYLPAIDTRQQETLGQLHGQTMQIALLGGEPQIAQDIQNVRRQLMDQDRRQKEGIQEIKLILNHVLQCEVVELLKKQVDEDVAREIEQLVEEQVAACLRNHIPHELQEEVARQERTLEQVRREFHNSESRRSNATLRSSHEDDTLHVIYKTDGSVPAAFPPNLKALFEMDAPTSRSLMTEYEMQDCSDSRERNLNRLMQFFGVRYQMVRDGSATRSVGLA